ncbi:Uncharacterised protein [Mycobacteroides abscessus]|nr:Uncharacterised protein [Mycobacteroides abscessus]SKU89237.1 Uncharacterised protein [Mycobacteroides abscessus subsp. massiliense]CPW85564.1 Uncharacterised protein [Mycobacteroides abscessus]SKU97464.1 Uncharacterised protein [Mycobacteroides abscessus subsp. massiliense]SKY02303.1 Uncharacterised protein [Mycobacteroides abscessus subsp. massiliense]
MSLRIIVPEEDEHLLKNKDFLDGLKELLLSIGVTHASLFDYTYQG